MKHTFYGALAVVLGIMGAIILVSGLMPFINPGSLEMNESEEYSPRLMFLTGTLVSLPFLGITWFLNQKARLMRQGTEGAVESPWEKKLKWVLCRFVILLMLAAFLW